MGQRRQRIERTVLHVDDDPAMTQLIAARLKTAGYQVTSLNDPTQAMKQLQGGAFRVVLLDVAMPGVHGMDLLRQIKAYDGGIQVIMLTALTTMTTVLEAMRAGAEACHFKPVKDISPMTDSIEKAFDKLDCWWYALDDLRRRRISEQPETEIRKKVAAAAVAVDVEP